MFATALIDKINPDKKPIERTKFHKGKPIKTVVQPMFCIKNEKLGVISKIPKVYNDDYFVLVINKNDEVFSLKSNEITPIPDFIQKINFTNRTPKFIDFLDVQEFSLDLL